MILKADFIGKKSMASGLTALLFLVGLSASAAAQNNTAFGTSALSSITTGSADSAFGDSALREDQTGSQNTAVGYGAMYNNISGNYNTAMGVGALDLDNGDSNSAFGWNAL